MSDYSDFCKMYGGSANDPAFMDNWLSEHANGEEFTNNTIKCVTVLLNSQQHDYYNEWMIKNNYRFENWVYDNLTYNDSVEHNKYIKITPPHIIHVVKLLSEDNKKAIPVEAQFNIEIDKSLLLCLETEFNELTSTAPKAPAQWFIKRDFYVFSTLKKENGNSYWYQIALKESNDKYDRDRYILNENDIASYAKFQEQEFQLKFI